MTGIQLMTAVQIRAFVNAALADPTVELAIPLGMSFAFREGLKTEVLTSLSAGTTTRPSVTCREA
ncbi:hypothetical protein OHA02_52145 [Streptomyces phaeochromogenes]|nr:hypothetical protein [Streptomyces phaeochromogenes]